MTGGTQALIDTLVRETNTGSPEQAVRQKARELIREFVAAFGDEQRPTVDQLRSFRGIAVSGDPPIHSQDAELVPTGDGRMEIRVSADRPETRQRFSVAHEICHTFFPEYKTKVWCRPNARYRDRNNPDERLEMLCDIGAAELVFPMPWFRTSAARVDSAAGLIELAAEYGASREATLRRFAEASEQAMAAVFFIWKLKPTEKPSVGQLGLFEEYDPGPTARLRVDYAISSAAHRRSDRFVPPDKSVQPEGPLYAAASTGRACDGECYLDLGPAAGRFHVMALPTWTVDQELGPNGEQAVAAILRPLDIRASPQADQLFV